jgi:hypothetical protein
VVVSPVRTAIGLLEGLSDGPLLFPSSATRAHRSRPGHAHARRGNAMITDIGDFISWVNATFTMSGSALPIPPDPAGHIYGTRLRRTLAYFIIRQPRGLIAAALQYGHVSTKVTLQQAMPGGPIRPGSMTWPWRSWNWSWARHSRTWPGSGTGARQRPVGR